MVKLPIASLCRPRWAPCKPIALARYRVPRHRGVEVEWRVQDITGVPSYRQIDSGLKSTGFPRRQVVPRFKGHQFSKTESAPALPSRGPAVGNETKECDVNDGGFVAMQFGIGDEQTFQSPAQRIHRAPFRWSSRFDRDAPAGNFTRCSPTGIIFKYIVYVESRRRLR